MRGISTRFALTLLALSAPSFAQTTAPATTDSPKGALKALTLALNSGDEAAVTSIMKADDAKQQKMVTVMGAMSHAVAQLNKALTAKFGADQAKTVLGDDKEALQQSLATIETADVKIDGDTATVTVGGKAESALRLVKVADAWKVTIGEQAKSVTPEQVDTQVKMSMGQVKTLDQTAADVTAGKFASAGDVATSLREKMVAPEVPAAAPAVTTAPIAPGGAGTSIKP